jgi:hypothetical protein
MKKTARFYLLLCWFLQAFDWELFLVKAIETGEISGGDWRDKTFLENRTTFPFPLPQSLCFCWKETRCH